MKSLGPDGAISVAKAGTKAQDALRDFCTRPGRDVWWREGGNLLVSTTARQDRKIARELGVDEVVGELSATDVASRCRSASFRGGLLFDEGATVHPARLVSALRSSAVDAGVRIFENVRMVKLDRGGHIRVTTSADEILARDVVLATNVDVASCVGRAAKVTVFSSYAVMTAPAPEAIAAAGWHGDEGMADLRMFLRYFRKTPDGRILMGSGSGPIAYGTDTRSAPCAVPALVARRRLGKAVPCHGRHAGLRIRPDRQHHLEGSRRCDRRKRGAEAAAIGRSRGGLTTKLHAAVDAIGLPIRICLTPGHRGDAPQAENLLAGLLGVGHVIADAAYDADPLRASIADELRATAQIKANPSRTGKPPIDWRLYKERHQVECFFNKLKRRRCPPCILGRTHAAEWPSSRQAAHAKLATPTDPYYHNSMNIEIASQMLDALGHPTRLRLFHAIANAGDEGIAVGALTENLGGSPATISHHLAKLTGCGLVTQTRVGTTLLCTARSRPLMSLAAYLLQPGE